MGIIANELYTREYPLTGYDQKTSLFSFVYLLHLPSDVIIQLMLEVESVRSRRRLILIAVTLATLPCYCLGWIAVQLAPDPNAITSTPTITPITASATGTLGIFTPTNSLTAIILTETASLTPTETATPTITDTPFQPATATSTFTQTATDTATFTPTFTPSVTPTFTSTPTPTSTPTITNTPTATFTPSNTPVPSVTSFPTQTP